MPDPSGLGANEDQGQRLAHARIRLVLTYGRLKGAWLEYRKSSMGLIGLGLIIVFAIMAVIHPILIDNVWPSGIYDPQVGFDPNYFHPSPPPRQTIYLAPMPLAVTS